MSLGKDNNGREMMMRDAFGRVRLEGHVVARPKKKSGARRRIGEADPRGLESHRARPEVWASEGRYAQDCDDRAWFKIAYFFPYISHRVIAYLDPCRRIADALDDF